MYVIYNNLGEAVARCYERKEAEQLAKKLGGDWKYVDGYAHFC